MFLNFLQGRSAHQARAFLEVEDQGSAARVAGDKLGKAAGPSWSARFHFDGKKSRAGFDDKIHHGTTFAPIHDLVELVAEFGANRTLEKMPAPLGVAVHLGGVALRVHKAATSSKAKSVMPSTCFWLRQPRIEPLDKAGSFCACFSNPKLGPKIPSLPLTSSIERVFQGRQFSVR